MSFALDNVIPSYFKLCPYLFTQHTKLAILTSYSYLVGFHGVWGMRKVEKEVGERRRNPIRIRRASPNLQQYNTDLPSNM